MLHSPFPLLLTLLLLIDSRDSDMTHIHTVHQVEQLFHTVLPFPSFPSFDLLGAVLEVFSGSNALGLLALLANGRGDLSISASSIREYMNRNYGSHPPVPPLLPLLHPHLNLSPLIRPLLPRRLILLSWAPQHGR